MDVLDVVEVHRDVRDVAKETHPLAVRGDVDVLAYVRAVEEQRVGAVLTFDDVAPVTGIPLEEVVASAEVRDVVALLPIHEVVPVTTEEEVRAPATEDCVVAGATVERELLQDPRLQGRGIDRVVAVEAVDDELVVGALQIRDSHRRRKPDDGRGGTAPNHLDGIGAVRAA